ncbi:MAG: tol-pal system YbgF family protein [Phycisphaerae bacterium]
MPRRRRSRAALDREPGRAWLVVVVSVALALALAGGVRAGGDAVVDAKRRAAAEMLRANKPADAVALLREVITATGGKDWRDQLALARCHDKLGATDEAVQAYQRVLAMVPADAKAADERAARAEADRRVKVLDPNAGKVEKAVAEFAKRLDGLDKEFRAAKDARGQARVVRLRAALTAAGFGEGAGAPRGFEVRADGQWQDTGIQLVAGKRYRIRALGKWRVSPAVECDSEGDKSRPRNEWGHPGALLMQTGGSPAYAAVPAETTFTAPAAMTLTVTMNEGGEQKKDNSGSINLVVEPLD